ncbi:MAG: alpha/beta fold hydrolase [Lysobacter sp.]|nr:alpha/beta fold hydrolase [Lysobacter sp.]
MPVEAGDGHRFRLLARRPEAPVAALLWLPALGVAARHYLPFAEALTRHGIAVFVHEWRGHGSSDRRAGHDSDWGYRELLDHDLPASLAAMRTQAPGLPRIVGGHSLGGQLAACLLGLDSAAASRLWLVASGAPYWSAFPRPRRWLLPLAYRFLPWLAERRGALPGRTIGFGGTEARGVMRDWARTGLSGRYAGAGMGRDLEAALGTVTAEVDAVLCADDWLAPRSSLDFLLGKMRPAGLRCARLDAAALGTQADHFAWMRRPEAVARALAAGSDQPSA